MAGAVNMEAERQLPGRVIGLVGIDGYKRFGTGYSQDDVTKITAPFKADFVTATDGFVRSMFSENADSASIDRIAADGGYRVANAAQHLHGGIGSDLDYPVHRYFLWTKELELFLGSGMTALVELGAWMAQNVPQEEL